MSTALPTTDFAFPTPPTPLPQVEGPTPKRWTRKEYHELDELGVFRGQRVELIDGEIIQLSPQKFPHAFSVDEVQEILHEVFREGYWVRSQLPLIHGDSSEPEPDVSVVKGNKREFSDHPTVAILVVEVSKSSLKYDKSMKASHYAKFGIPDYWILDLAGRQLLVHREPITDESAPLGHRYNSVEAIPHDGTVSPLEKPEAKLAVADILPPVEKAKSKN